MKKEPRKLAWGIAYCLAYGKRMSEADIERLQQLVEAEDMPQGVQGDEVSLIAEAARRIVGPIDDEEIIPQMKEELPKDCLLQISEWLNFPRIALVMGGATKIKQYVFESAKLPEIRGASGLLDRINLEGLCFLWRDGLGCEDCIIYNNGGEVLAFAPESRAKWLADEIERIYTHETLVAQSVAVWQAFTLKQLREGLLADVNVDDRVIKGLLGYNPAEKKTFGNLVVLLALAKFRRREANPDEGRSPKLRALSHFETAPFQRRCSSCERRGAVVNAHVADEDRPLCEPCARKRVFGQLVKREDADLRWWDKAQFEWQPEDESRKAESWMTRFENWLDGHSEWKEKYAVDDDGKPLANWDKLGIANDLGEIAQVATPDGFIGVVYADGNNMGALIERKLTTPSKYAHFAITVFDALQDAVFSALAKHLRTASVTSERGAKRLVHPFEILSIGGDDLFLIVPAHAALPIACEVAKLTEECLRTDDLLRAGGYSWSDAQRCAQPPDTLTISQCEVSLSVGVVLADAHTPVFYLEELANQLLKSAKRRAKWLKRERKYYGGTIDFLALKSVTMISGTVDEFRKAALTREDKRFRIYAGPYTITEMESLLASVRSLKSADFPRSQLYRLSESLRKSKEQSTVDYLYFLSRGDKVPEARGKIEQKWTPNSSQVLAHPWRRQLEEEDRWETIWHDLVELYDFVPEEEQNHAQHHD